MNKKISITACVTTRIVGVCIAIASALAASACHAEEKSVASSELREYPFPQRNDVTMRTLRFRDVAPGSEMDPFPALEVFFATRLEWVYLSFTEEEQAKIDRVKASGRVFGGAGGGQLSCWLGDKSLLGWRENLSMLDLDGNPVIMPHKRQWTNPHYIGDVSNPDYLEGHIAYYKKYIEMGADTLQRDEAESPVFAVKKYGGGFTETGLAGFADWLGAHLDRPTLLNLGIEDVSGFRYDTYLRDQGAPVGDAFSAFKDPIKPYWEKYWTELTEQFFATLITEIKKAADRPITFSCNNTSLQIWEKSHLEFDFAISELLLGSANPRHIWERSEVARSNGKFQVFGSPKTRGTEVNHDDKVALTRKVIATAYASGSASRVPWDIFQQTSDGSGRYFGAPEEYASYYAFVRAQDWSGYNEISAAGPEIIDGGLSQDTISVAGNEGLYIFVHKKQDAPTLIHLVDWGTPTVPIPHRSEMSFLEVESTGERVYFSQDGEENMNRTAAMPATLRLDLDDFGIHRGTLISLRTPKPFDSLEDGSPAFNEQRLKARIESGKCVVEIEALSPWGILVLDN